MSSNRVVLCLTNEDKYEIAIEDVEILNGDSMIKGINLKNNEYTEILSSSIEDIDNKCSVYHNYKNETVFLTFEEAIRLASDNQIKNSLKILTEKEAFIYIMENRIQIKRIRNHYARESLGEIKDYVEGKSGFKSFYARNIIDLCNYFEIAKHSIKDELESFDWYQEQHLYAK